MKNILKIILYGILSISVIGCNKKPEAKFNLSFLNSQGLTYWVGKKIYFENKSLNAYSYHWDFGDGTNSSDKNPFHYFKKPGIYNVTLSVFSKNNKKNSFSTQQIKVDYADFDYQIKIGNQIISTDSSGFSHDYATTMYSTSSFAEIQFSKIINNSYSFTFRKGGINGNLTDSVFKFFILNQNNNFSLNASSGFEITLNGQINNTSFSNLSTSNSLGDQLGSKISINYIDEKTTSTGYIVIVKLNFECKLYDYNGNITPMKGFYIGKFLNKH